jgi:hypothetical protein
VHGAKVGEYRRGVVSPIIGLVVGLPASSYFRVVKDG